MNDPHPDDLLGQRIVNTAASESTPTTIVLREAWAAICTLRADLRTKAATIAALDQDRDAVFAERDDYRNLFRDACESIAHIATAAGFSPTDENVEPPDVAAGVENMRAALSKAEKERDEALQRLADARAPVNGVDPEEVLNRADIIGTDVDWDDLSDAQWRAMVDQITAAPALAREVVALRLAILSATRAFESGDFSGLGTANPDLQPLLDAAIARLRGVEREGDAARADLAALRIEHDAWGVLLDAARRDRDAARTEAAELRLTLAAERGLPEGAVSEGWAPSGGLLREWQKCYPDGTEAQVSADGRWWRGYRGVLPSWPDRPGRRAQTLAEGPAGLKRAAMQAADKAIGLPAQSPDPRPSNHLLTLTPDLLERVVALGYVPGETPAGVLPWLVAELHEARLTLAAEQGKPEGAPPGWEWTGSMWRRNGYPHAVTARHHEPTNSDHPWQWEVWDTRPAFDVRLLGKGYAPTASAAMRAADAANPS